MKKKLENRSYCYSVFRFSNGEVKLWDLSSGGQCVFQPSSTALILDEQADLGTVANHVNCVALNDKVTVAGYSQGKQ